MDSSSFDRLARFISNDASRRGVLRSAFAAAVAGMGITSLLSTEDVEAKSCLKKCNKKKSNAAKKKCKKKCSQQGRGNSGQGGNGGNQGQGKAAGTLCDATGECTAPNICDVPVNDSGGDKRCCAPTGAPCGLKTEDGDDTSPFCCRGNTCTSTPTTQGTCQPTPDE